MASSAAPTSTTPTPPTSSPTPTSTPLTTSISSATSSIPTTSSSPTSTSSPSDNTSTSSPLQQTTANSGSTSAATIPVQSSSNGSASGSSSATSSTAETSSITTLSVASTSVGETTMVTTSSNGQIFTSISTFTTTIQAGSVVTAVNQPTASPSNRTNTGAIVGGVVGGIGGLIIFAALIFFCLRKRRKDEFDGNFDPANVGSGGGGGGTLPKIDLGESGLLMSNNGAGVDEDDGMGGRLGAGPGGGGIITPYAFQPAPVGGSAVGGQQYQNQPQMQQMSNIGVAADGVGAAMAAGYPNEKRTMRQQQYAQHSPNQSVSSGSLYPSSSHANQHMNLNNVSPEPYAATSDGASSVGGSGSGGIYYQSMGRGPSPGPSVMSSSSGGRNAKEMEAMGRVIANPDGSGPQHLPAFQQAYLQSGPGPHQHQQQQQQQYLSSSSSTPTAVPSSQPQYPPQAHSPTPSAPGTAVVVHEDGGRVVLRKGEEADGEREEVLSPEIPPTYDSLPVDVRRDV